MDRRYSIKYRAPGVTREAQQQRCAQSATYDSSTDNDIFALGDAATGFNIDDLFKDFGMSLNQALQGQFPQIPGQGPTRVSYQLHKPAIPEETENGTEQGAEQTEVSPDHPPSSSSDTVPLPGILPPKGHTLIETSTISPKPQVSDDGSPRLPGKQDIQVSTITKTLPDGRTVQTRIVRGPVQRKARIIKINRELPNGETELLSTLQLPGDQEVDINETVKNIVAGTNKQAEIQGKVPEAVVAGIKREQKPQPLEQYDNMPQHNHVKPFPTPVQAPLADISEDIKPAPPRRQSLKEKLRDKFRSRSSSASSVPLTPTPSSDSQRSPFERTNSLGPIYGYER